jgi:ATP-dependent Lon protease
MVDIALAGDRCFGVILLDPIMGRAASVGCSVEIREVEKLPGGRMNILTEGRQRFHVLECHKDLPYLVGSVEWIDDRSSDEDLRELAADVRRLLDDVVYLSGKLKDARAALPDVLPETPKELSYWIASNIYGDLLEKQRLLELQDTGVRLRQQAEILGSLRGQLAARTALKDALG